MLMSTRTQYALRAIFELARHQGEGPVKIADVARAQAIPPRFLEVILNQLKRTGFVASRRGNDGGYQLLRSPEDLTVGEVIRFIQGPLGPVDCVADGGQDDCPLHAGCVFLPMWKKVREVTAAVYDGTTFQDLVDRQPQESDGYVPSYTI